MSSHRSRSRRPPSLNLSLSSRGSSPATSGSNSPEPESDEELHDAPSFDDRPSRPISTSSSQKEPADMRMYPAGPYCFKQPTLADVLSNTAPPPYTLPAFMAYLSQNHCLETLEFTMDASRYRKHYNKVTKQQQQQQHPSPDSKDCCQVRKLWKKLLDAYIVPNGPREVNLPCSVRDKLLSIPNSRTPPPPETLEPAVNIIHELMQESVLVPFLSECQNTNAFGPEPCSIPRNCSDENIYMRGSLDERFLLRRKRENSPSSPVDFVSNSYAAGQRLPPRTTSPFSASLGWPGRSHHSHHSSHPSGSFSSAESMLTADESGASTPSTWGTPMTPPTTPPNCEQGSHHQGRMGSPNNNNNNNNNKAEKGWKRMTGGLGRGLGFGKKKPEHGFY